MIFPVSIQCFITMSSKCCMYVLSARPEIGDILNEGITMCLEIKYYNISVCQHNLIIYL